MCRIICNNNFTFRFPVRRHLSCRTRPFAGIEPTRMSSSFKAALIDLNGTLFVGDNAISGSIHALSELRNHGLQVRFVTNTTKDTSANLQALLLKLGFEIPPQEIISSLGAAKKLLKDRGLRPFLLMHPRALPEFDGIEQQEPNAVLVGLAMDAFSYENMNAAFRVLLENPEAPLIAIHKGRYFKDSQGGLSLGPGPYVAALEYSTGRQAEVVGKPEAAFFQTVLDEVGCRPEEAVMIGDDVRDDVGGAQAAGLSGILVKTGKYREGDETNSGVHPNAVVQDFAAAVKWILQETPRTGKNNPA